MFFKQKLLIEAINHLTHIQSKHIIIHQFSSTFM